MMDNSYKIYEYYEYLKENVHYHFVGYFKSNSRYFYDCIHSEYEYNFFFFKLIFIIDNNYNNM